MRSLLLLTCVLFAGYSSAQPTTINLEQGEYFDASVITSLEIVEKCYLTTPNNDDINFKPIDESNERYQLLEDMEFVSRCRVRVLDLTPNDDGLWTLYAVVASGDILPQSYNVTVTPNAVTEPETEAPPVIREVKPQYLDEQAAETSLGSVHDFSIPDYDFVTGESCEIINPDGETFDLKSQTINGAILYTEKSHCGVTITVYGEDQVGNWTLVEKGKRYSTDDFEKRLPIVISVEVIVEAFSRNITVGERHNLHVSLANSISNPETCRLLSPNGASFVVDSEYLTSNCEFSVLDVTKEHNGTWAIVYGKRILYRAPFDVHVIGRTENANIVTLVWTLYRSVQTTVGPEDAIYCKVTSPNGEVFEGFGKCNITIERVTLWHAGNWRMSVGLPGHVIAEDSTFNVQVHEAEPKATVTTHVEAIEPSVTISCSVQSSSPVNICKFRDPRGVILMAHEGVSQNRYSYYRATHGQQENNQTQTCGLKITNPNVQELGFWRCAMQTDEDLFYGHLSVRCPWLLRDPEVAAAIPSEPMLTARTPLVEAVAGDTVTMSCSMPAALRYCYFRASNGTIYHMAPGVSGGMQYAGAGLDAGECGARLAASARDAGNWTCHAAVQHEQRRSVVLRVTTPLSVRQQNIGDVVTVRAQLNMFVRLDYCVFVRSDGAGFTRFNAPENYEIIEYPSDGSCQLQIRRPSTVEWRRWTVIAKQTGQDGAEVEISDVIMPLPPVYSFRFPTVWLAVMLIGLCMALLAAIMTPNRNRRWVASRASSVSHTIRNSFRKTPQTNNTPMAA